MLPPEPLGTFDSSEGGQGGACDKSEGKGAFEGPVCPYGQLCLVGGALKTPGREVGLIFFCFIFPFYSLLYTLC